MAKFRLIENAVDRLLGMIAYDVEAEAVEKAPVCSGQLRNSIGVQHPQRGLWIVGTNLKYAPVVHDGRPAITIKPKRKKALAFWRRRTCPPKLPGILPQYAQEALGKRLHSPRAYAQGEIYWTPFSPDPVLIGLPLRQYLPVCLYPPPYLL